MLRFQLKVFTTEEINGCINDNEAAKGGSKAPSNHFFFISCFTVSVTSSVNTTESSIDFMIFITSFISSFVINKVNPFLALTTPFRLTFLSNLFIAFEIKSFNNPGKLSIA